MKMTQKEYEQLMADFAFLEDKVDPAYKKETEKVLEQLEEEYKKYIVG